VLLLLLLPVVDVLRTMLLLLLLQIALQGEKIHQLRFCCCRLCQCQQTLLILLPLLLMELQEKSQ
jgi:hypothetical protein